MISCHSTSSVPASGVPGWPSAAGVPFLFPIRISAYRGRHEKFENESNAPPSIVLLKTEKYNGAFNSSDSVQVPSLIKTCLVLWSLHLDLARWSGQRPWPSTQVHEPWTYHQINHYNRKHVHDLKCVGQCLSLLSAVNLPIQESEELV